MTPWLALFLSVLAAPAGAKTPAGACSGRFVVDGTGPLIAGGRALVRDAVVLHGGLVTIDSACAPRKGTVRAKKTATRLGVRWRRCGTRRMVRLVARIDGACTMMKGTLRARGRKGARFVARRSDRFEPTDCAFTLPFGQKPETVRCGRLTVPERRQAPDGRTIALAVAVLQATGTAPASDPLVFLNGGPGAATLRLLIQAFLPAVVAPIQTRRDIVFLDLRGTGLSEPALRCPEYDASQAAWDDQDRLLGALVACRDRLANAGVDLDAYTSAASAADVRDLVTELGYPEWNLFGLSYGARLALTAVCEDPSGIRSLILNSPYPLEANAGFEYPLRLQHALETLFAACRTDPACDQTFPSIGETFYRLIDHLNAEPVTVDLPDVATRTTRTRIVTGDRLVQLVQGAFFDYDQVRRLPSVISRVARGDAAALRDIPGPMAGPDTMQSGAFHATWCAEEVPFYTPELAAQSVTGLRAELSRFGQGSIAAATAACERWGLGRPAPRENMPVVSDVPALILEGELDPGNQSPSYAGMAARTLSRSTFFELLGFPHAVSFAPVADFVAMRPTCGLQLAAEFLDQPTARPAGRCVAELPPLRFDGATGADG